MLRKTLEELRKEDKLLECDVEVDPIYEMGGILSHFNNKRPILFNRVKGYSMRSIGGLYGDREIVYQLLNVNRENRIEALMKAIVNPSPYRLVKDGPVRENIIKRNIDLERILPINRFQEKDSASYITAGLLVVKDPDTGKYFTSVRRLQVLAGNRLSALIASPKLSNDFLKLEEEGRSLEVAVVFGYDAPLLMASQIPSSTYGVDKYQMASSLAGGPIDLVKCETVDLLVPAQAELVLEGRLIPGKRELEGPFGELMGYYGKRSPHPYIEVDAILHRDNPIYQTAFPCREEHITNGLIREAELYYHLKNQVDVIDVHVTEGGGYRFNAFVSLRKKREGDGKTAILAALGLNKDLKHVVIVDEDVDIYDLQDIEWAITTRSQASLDYIIAEGCLGSSLEPSHDLRGVTDKLGIDATRPLLDEEGNFSRSRIPKYDKIDPGKYFPNI